jgi:hypothetical protein
MGMFRDFKGMVDVARSDELKEMKKLAAAQPKRSMMDGMRAATTAMHQANGAQAAAEDGIAGQATINSIASTGTMVNNSLLIAFDLTVSVPGGEPYRVEHTQLISPLAMPRYQAGATMPVHVAPGDPDSVFLAG